MMQKPRTWNDEQSAVIHDQFDAQAFQQTRAQFPALDEVAASPRLPEAEQFAEDAFCTFYKPAPMLTDEDRLNLSAQVRRRMIDEMMATAEYQQARASGTIQDPYSSGIATAAVSYQIIDRLDSKTKQQMRALQQIEQQAQQLFNQAQALHNLAEQAEGDEQNDLEQEAGAKEQQAQQQQARAQSLFNQLEQGMEKIEDAARRAARAGLQQANQEIEETNNAVNAYSGYSLEQGQPGQRMSVQEKMELAKRLKSNKKLARIAELAGKMVNTALRKQRNKVIHPPDEVVGITTSDDLAHLVPSELVLLEEELTEMLFYQRYTERALLTFDMIGHEPQARGPIICVVDESGSMDAALISQRRLARRVKGMSPEDATTARREAYERAYTKEVWSKAVILALLAVARHQHRDLCVLYFSGPGALMRYDFPKAQASTASLLDMAAFFWDGGTSFDSWMPESLKIAETAMFESADLIVISDGDADISDQIRAEYNERRDAKKMHAYGVLLSERPQDGENLKSVTDAMIHIADLEADGRALDLMFNI
jgi:uncharacterized protein with von Willebrand factor type A (vWA) domain